jgi:hypothetical protein
MEVSLNEAKFLNRKDAGAYLRAKYGIGSSRTLAKGASVGDTPPFHKFGGHRVVYSVADLDQWALSKISAARQSTSDAA